MREGGARGCVGCGVRYGGCRQCMRCEWTRLQVHACKPLQPHCQLPPTTAQLDAGAHALPCCQKEGALPASPVEVVACRAAVHHLHRTARQPKGHGPQRAHARPVDHSVHLGDNIVHCLGGCGRHSLGGRARCRHGGRRAAAGEGAWRVGALSRRCCLQQRGRTNSRSGKYRQPLIT